MQFAKYVKVRSEKFGAVVFDTLNEKVFVTNETGKEILSLMADGLSTAEVAEQLGGRYDVGSSRIQEEIAAFIDGLQSAGLLAGSVEEQA